MLDRIGDVDGRAVDTGFLHRAIQQFSRRPDERFSLQVLLVTRHLADHDDLGVLRPFAEHRPRGVFVEVAARAIGRLGAEPRDGVFSPMSGMSTSAAKRSFWGMFASTPENGEGPPSVPEPSRSSERPLTRRLLGACIYEPTLYHAGLGVTLSGAGGDDGWLDQFRTQARAANRTVLALTAALFVGWIAIIEPTYSELKAVVREIWTRFS